MRTRGIVSSVFVLAAVASACGNETRNDPVEVTPGVGVTRVRAYNGYGPPPNGGTQPGADCNAIRMSNGIDAYCWPIQNAGVFPSPDQTECWCSGGTDVCMDQGCNNPDPQCKCPNNGTCRLNGTCASCDGGGCTDAGDAGDAGGCDTVPMYPAPTSNDTQRIMLGYDLPEPAASWACAQLAAIPYLGQVLFTPGGGIGFTAELTGSEASEWKPTCREESSKTLGAGISVNICSLEATGRWSKTTTEAKQHCVNCDPPPATCGDVACREEIDDQTRAATISKTFSIPLGRSGSTCAEGAPPPSRWLDWIKRHVNVSATLGGGWNGRGTETTRTTGGAMCAQTCTPCDTQFDRNAIFVQANGTASVSTPTWGGLSGSAFVSLTGRVGVGREDRSSTCAPSCGGYDADASVTLRIGISAGAFGYRIGRSVGYTCAWRNSWSSCPGAADGNTRECRWANATDP